MANETLTVSPETDGGDLTGLKPDVAVVVHALSSNQRWKEVCEAGTHTFRDYIRTTFPEFSENDVLGAADKLHKAYNIFHDSDDVKVVAFALRAMAESGMNVWDEEEGFSSVIEFMGANEAVWDAPDLPTPTGPPQSFGGPRVSVCRFFMTPAGCRNGASCQFSHDTSAPTVPSKAPCRFFAQGNCQYGSSCNYSHESAGPGARPTFGRSGNVTADELKEDGKAMILGGPNGMVEAELDPNGNPIVPKGCSLVNVLADGTIVCPPPQ